MLWAHELERIGPRRFCEIAHEITEQPPEKVGLVEGAWAWAGRQDSVERLQGILDGPDAGNIALEPESFLVIDVGRHVLDSGHVVKVMHPDALPLPSCHAQTRLLAEHLGVTVDLPVPLT
jgi:hypothetical protein